MSKLVDLNCSVNNYISGIPNNEFFDGLSICISEPEPRVFHAAFMLNFKDDPRYRVTIHANSFWSSYCPLELTIEDVKSNRLYESDSGQYKVMLDKMEAQCIVSKMFSVLIDFIRSDHVAEPISPHTYTLSKGKEKLDE